MQRFAAIVRLALFLALAGVFGGHPAALARNAYPGEITATARLSELPPEARETLLLIRRGGPFPYPHKDGSTFRNFEKRLPKQAYGYYREYTVPTPGSNNRGPRRIIAGSGRNDDVRTSGEYYYTGDHYRSFYRIREP